MTNKFQFFLFLLLSVLSLNACKQQGCTDPNSLNFDPEAQKDDGTCIAKIEGCTDPSALNYDSTANFDDGSCSFSVNGCMDSTALNYNPLATTDDGGCIYAVHGCMDSTATNYNPLATVDDGSCSIEGCMDSTALNYNPLATTDDGSCISAIYGCLDSFAVNYNPLANVSDTCTYATDNYIGNWTVVTDYWASDNCNGGVESYTINILQGNQSHQIIINNFGNAISGMVFNTYQDSVIGTNQSGFFDVFNHQWDMVSSKGIMDGDTLRLLYHLNDGAYSNSCGNLTGDVTAVYQ